MMLQTYWLLRDVQGGFHGENDLTIAEIDKFMKVAKIKQKNVIKRYDKAPVNVRKVVEYVRTVNGEHPDKN